MAETSGFFDAVYEESSGEWDLTYFAEQFASYFALFVGNGVFGSPTNQLKVLAENDMNIKVLPGWAFINGYWYHNDSELTLPVVPNNSSSSRSDSIVCRWNNATRQITVVYQVGDTSLTRDASYYDLKLAEIIVSPRATAISDSNITDTRPDESVCGFVTHVLEVETTADLFAQYQAAFTELFDTMKDQLSGDLAIRLQMEFLELNEKVDNYQTNVDEDVEEIQEIAENAKQTIQDFVAGDFVIPLQALTFVNGVCVVNDGRVTEDSLVDVYFTAESTIIAESSQIYVDSADGKIILTAKIQPVAPLNAKIRVRVE